MWKFSKWLDHDCILRYKLTKNEKHVLLACTREQIPIQWCQYTINEYAKMIPASSLHIFDNGFPSLPAIKTKIA